MNRNIMRGLTSVIAVAGVALPLSPANAAPHVGAHDGPRGGQNRPGVSPGAQIPGRDARPVSARDDRGPRLQSPSEQLLDASSFYSYDGSGNNPGQSSWGAAGLALLRNAANGYDDGVSTAAGATRPSARAISNALSAQATSVVNNRDM